MRKVVTTIQEVGRETGSNPEATRTISIESDWLYKQDRIVLKLDGDYQIRVLAKDLIAAVQNATNFRPNE